MKKSKYSVTITIKRGKENISVNTVYVMAFDASLAMQAGMQADGVMGFMAGRDHIDVVAKKMKGGAA